jgi:hypothetical protein
LFCGSRPGRAGAVRPQVPDVRESGSTFRDRTEHMFVSSTRGGMLSSRTLICNASPGQGGTRRGIRGPWAARTAPRLSQGGVQSASVG